MPTPINPTEGVSVGAIIPRPDYEAIDASTGQYVSLIKRCENGSDSDDNLNIDRKPKTFTQGCAPLATQLGK